MTLERKPLGDGRILRSRRLEAEGFLAVFTERTGGSSEGPFATLNLSYSVGDDDGCVSSNRSSLILSLGIPPFAVGGQVHGANVFRVDAADAGRGFGGPAETIPATDAMVTNEPDLPMAVATADCAPVILASPREGAAAIVHAGWRGIAAGVVSGAALAFEDPAGVLAAIGPAAGPCHYEVGDEVEAAVAAASPSGVRSERRRGRRFLDLAGTIEGILRDLGVRTIDAEKSCTIHEEQRFFSHRRQGVSGRQMAMVMKMGNK
jgi:hypothetical protein